MKIINDIKTVHGNLANTNVRFLEFVEKKPDTLKRSNFNLLELNHQVFKLQPWPTFINQSRRKEMEEAGTIVCNLTKSLPKRLFNNDPHKISQYYEIPLHEAERQLKGISTRHLDNLMARGDFILSPSDGWKCLEYNVTAHLGGWQIPMWEPLYLSTPVISKFFEEYKPRIINQNLISILLSHVIENTLNNSLDNNGEIITALAIPMQDFKRNTSKHFELYINHLYRRELNKKDKRLRGEVIICTDNDLSVHNNFVFYKDKKINSLIELNREYGKDEVANVLEAGNICLYNGNIKELLGYKLNMALLSENGDSGYFTDEEKKQIKKYIPWTRKIIPGYTHYKGKKVELKNFIIGNRENLIIKPSPGYGGDGVHIGPKISQNRWEEAIETAFRKKNWLVQEYIEPTAYLYQQGENGCALHDTVWGFFIFGPHYAGEWIRVLSQESNQGVINCHQGAEVSVIFEIEE
jgi:hypothetical protein